MIRTAIIYGMIDWCLDIVFDRINFNLMPPTITEDGVVVHVGDQYEILRVRKGSDAIYYFDCTITTVDGYTVFFLHSGHYGIRKASGELHFHECEECSIADARDILTLD